MSKPITIRNALLEARRALPGDEAALDTEVLLMHALGIDRAQLYQRFDDEMTGEQSAAYASLIARRRKHEPLAYITGHREFFALDFEVSPAVLIPRPETETLVELAIAFARERFSSQTITIADVGTGSGIIAVSLAHALPKAHVTAIDLSPDALAIARRNAARHGVADRIDFREGNLLAPLTEPVQIIASNPPYVTTEQLNTSQPEIRDYEPTLSLNGGDDGLDVIRRLLSEAPSHVVSGGALFCEIGDWQGEAVRILATDAFPAARVEIAKDLADLDRVLAVYA